MFYLALAVSKTAFAAKTMGDILKDFIQLQGFHPASCRRYQRSGYRYRLRCEWICQGSLP